MAPWDKDFQFMAITDLLIELQKDNANLDAELQEELVRALLKLLDDQHSEIQNLTMKCLEILVKKVNECQLEQILKALCYNMIYEKEKLQNVSSIGLKNVIEELPEESNKVSGNICSIILGELTIGIDKQEDVAVQVEALGIISDILLKFGPLIQSYHETILPILLTRLRSQHQAIRKRAMYGCSNLVLSCNDMLYTELIDHLFDELNSPVHNSQIETCVQCVGLVCLQSKDKFGEHVENFVPSILKYTDIENSDELREYCIQTFENFINGCPKDMTKYLERITALCLRYIVYDPYYNFYESDSEDFILDEDEGDNNNEEYNDDDDDMSWKVRKSTIKCLEAIIWNRHEQLPELYKTLSPILISRFSKEHEENVKSDIFHAYIALLKRIQPIINLNSDQSNTISEDKEITITLLQQQIMLLVKEVQGQIREKSMRTRQDCVQLLKEVCSVLPGAFTTHIGDIIPGILYSLSDQDASRNMKIDALAFLYCLLTSHQLQVFHSHINVLLPSVISAVRDNFYKITAEALKVLQILVKIIRPLNINSNFHFTPYINDIYNCTLQRFKTADIDQEVKEKAIFTMGQIVCNLGDHLESELPFCLSLFVDRLKNEITSLTTVKALIIIADSPLRIDLPIIPDIMPVLEMILRKNHRGLKLCTLQLIYCLIEKYHKDLTVQLLHPFVVEAPQLLDESDLDVARWTMKILNAVAMYHPRALQDFTNTIISKILLLVKFPLLQELVYEYRQITSVNIFLDEILQNLCI